MSEFRDLAVKVQKIDVYKILEDITKQSNVQKWVKDTVKNRWQRTGIDAFGNKAQTDSSSPGEVYSYLSNVLKENRSGIAGITDHITLTDTGQFWASFRLIVNRYGFETEADFLKSDGHMYENFTQDYTSRKEFESAVTGLSDNELSEMVEKYYYPLFIKKINEILQN